MSRSSPVATALFWLMFVVGGGCLVLSAYLPQWLAYRDLQQRHAAAQQRVHELERALTTVNKQIEHIQTDPAYIARIAHRQAGMDERFVQSIGVDEIAQSRPGKGGDEPSIEGDHVAQVVVEAARTHPVVSLFVLEQTRPTVMAMSAALVLIALALLNYRPRRVKAATDEESA